MSKPLSFFIAGIIQGSLPDSSHPQDYRGDISRIIRSKFPKAEIFDPVAEYPDSLSYTDTEAEEAFFELMYRSGEYDVLIAFVPEASMGTAIELWRSHRAGSLVVTVGGLERNWVVRYLSDRLLPDLSALQAYFKSGELEADFTRKRGKDD
ncbi:MAG: hypothetical protein LBU79_10160 [Planctomycetota bacterium]|nr:hypothetical protein [Planctomycetota bacterium]